MDPTSSWLLPRSTAIGWLNEEDTMSSKHLWWGPFTSTFCEHCTGFFQFGRFPASNVPSSFSVYWSALRTRSRRVWNTVRGRVRAKLGSALDNVLLFDFLNRADFQCTIILIKFLMWLYNTSYFNRQYLWIWIIAYAYTGCHKSLKKVEHLENNALWNKMVETKVVDYLAGF